MKQLIKIPIGHLKIGDKIFDTNLREVQIVEDIKTIDPLFQGGDSTYTVKVKIASKSLIKLIQYDSYAKVEIIVDLDEMENKC